jgi:hypothetical protein
MSQFLSNGLNLVLVSRMVNSHQSRNQKIIKKLSSIYSVILSIFRLYFTPQKAFNSNCVKSPGKGSDIRKITKYITREKKVSNYARDKN